MEDDDIIRLRMLAQLALQEKDPERYHLLVEDFNQLLLAKLMATKHRKSRGQVESTQPDVRI